MVTSLAHSSSVGVTHFTIHSVAATSASVQSASSLNVAGVERMGKGSEGKDLIQAILKNMMAALIFELYIHIDLHNVSYILACTVEAYLE